MSDEGGQIFDAYGETVEELLDQLEEYLDDVTEIHPLARTYIYCPLQVTLC